MRIKLAMLGAAAAAALSTVSFSGGALAAPCATGSAQSYINGVNVNCTVGDKTISDFNWVNVGAATAATVTVTPVVTPNPGLTFSSAAFANLNNDIPLNPNFRITAPSAEITDAVLSLACTGTCMGRFQDVEQLEGNTGTFVLTAGLDPTINLNSLTASLVFPTAQTSILVSDNADLNRGGGPNNLLSITKTFSQTPQVPEPASLALLASGLFGLGLLGRRRGKRA
jgi:hypothetical protein